ncbi:YqjF family protein [Halobacillus sp. B23F22_1]|uniref:YqjF family protein n=1 Tax=Halobacillus sp. B23F22_1 TaxID=3459514 RepID=UPI00373ECBB7
MYEPIIEQTDHRTFPLPDGHWIMTQRWQHLLFLHFPIKKETVEPYIPEDLSLDTYGGEAWITILPFEVSDMHIRKLPPFPSVNTYLELNVRTYVKCNGVSGLYFFSLDASKVLAVTGARMTTLPYYYAKMEMQKQDGRFQFSSKRKGKTGALLQGIYRPHSAIYYPKDESLEQWLLERYYAWSSLGSLLVEIGIHHTKWEVQEAQADIQAFNLIPFPVNEMIKPPLLHYVKSKRVLFWPLKLLKQAETKIK